MSDARFRAMKFGVTRVELRCNTSGVHYLRAEQALESYPATLTERFKHWVNAEPNRHWIARREPLHDHNVQIHWGDWQHLSYAEGWGKARRIAQSILNRNLGPGRPVVILSENSLEHALLALGCMLAGVPFVPTSPAYSLISKDYEKLRHVLRSVNPGLLFASDANRYGQAIAAVAADDIEVVFANGGFANRPFTRFQDLQGTQDTPAVDAAIAATNPDTIVKFLFTSGSTRLPKAVINTHRMLCANQQQMQQSMPVLADYPLVLVDWLSWNHTFGGNHNFNMVIFNGGTLYIDDGKTTPSLIGETLRNLREISPTVYFNVPTGFEYIANAMQKDATLREALLKRVRMFFYAAASLPQPVWDSLHAIAEQEIGERIVMTSGQGMTESGPFGLFVTSPHARAGDLGIPTPGMEVKLVEMHGKIEIRYKGPNITSGYWNAQQETTDAFDEEGHLRTGDAVKWIYETNIHLGLRIDGRLAEDFKLSTGTFVNVGPLRSALIFAGAPYVLDAVITGLNYKEVGAMVFPTTSIRELSELPQDAAMHAVIESAAVRAHFQEVVNKLANSATGSANRIARLCILSNPATLERGELTDKGSINQDAVLSQRALTVERLHADELAHVIRPLHQIKFERV